MDGDDRDRGTAAWCVALAIALAVNSVVGPLLADIVRYRFSPALLHQLVAIDLVALVVVAPLSLVGAVLLRRGRVGGAIVAAAAGAFTVYMTAQTIVGPDLAVAGNAERWFPWHLGLFVLGAVTLVRGWSVATTWPMSPWPRRRARATAVGLLAVAVFLVLGLWGPALADVMRDRPSNTDYLDNPAITWVVALLDLGVVAPLAVVSAAGLLRGRGWARRAAPIAALFLALTGTTVATMAWIMLAAGDDSASVGNAAVLTVVGSALVVVGVTALGPVLREETAAGTASTVAPAGEGPVGTVAAGTNGPAEPSRQALRGGRRDF